MSFAGGKLSWISRLIIITVLMRLVPLKKSKFEDLSHDGVFTFLIWLSSPLTIGIFLMLGLVEFIFGSSGSETQPLAMLGVS